MRSPNRVLLILLALCTSVSLAWSDARSDARTHYIAGQKAYAAASYKDAIKEFTAAQELAPADLNNYNLALCYDKLGDADNAISYYKQYLDKVPDAPKRAEIEASVSRLEGARKSAADKAEKAAAEKAAADKAAADKKPAADKPADKPDDAGTAKAGPAVVAPELPPPAMSNTATGSTGTPSSGLAVSTGDAQLDRVQSINIDQIRDQRMGGAGSGIAQPYGGPQPNGPQQLGQQGGPQPNGMAGMQAGNGSQQPPQGPQPTDKPNAPAETPVYKKWWFWVVVAVGAYVVYEIATQDSTTTSTGRTNMFDKGTNAYHQPSAGMTLLTF